MTQQTIRTIRLRSPRDVLATVPRLFGYRPSESLVFLNLHSGDGVSTMRLDLPGPDTDAETEKRFITSMAGLLCKVPEVVSTIVVAYTDGCFAGGDAPPRASFVLQLVERLELSGFDVHDVLCVAADGWSGYRGATAGPPHPLDELVVPAAGDDGSAPVLDGVESLAQLPPAGDLARRAFRAAIARELGCYADGDGPLVDPVEEAQAALALDVDAAGHDELAALLAVLLDPELRDVVLFTWAWGPARGRRLLAEGDRIACGEPVEDEQLLMDLVGLGSAEPPAPERLERADRLLRRLASLAPGSLVHVPLTLLAWLSFARGHGSLAGRFVERAREHDPAYGLADLLQSLLDQGMLPEWAYSRPV